MKPKDLNMGDDIPYTRLIYDSKYWINKDYLVEIKIYEIKRDKNYPNGLKYSLVSIKNRARLLGYDNHEGKGHHIHRGKREIPYEFVDVWQTIEDFYQEVDKILKNDKCKTYNN